MKVTIAIGVILAVLRVVIGFNVAPPALDATGHLVAAYTAFAHLFVGWLIYQSCSDWRLARWTAKAFPMDREPYVTTAGLLLGFLCAVEVFVAVLSRIGSQ